MLRLNGVRRIERLVKNVSGQTLHGDLQLRGVNDRLTHETRMTRFTSSVHAHRRSVANILSLSLQTISGAPPGCAGFRRRVINRTRAGHIPVNGCRPASPQDMVGFYIGWLNVFRM